MVTSPPKGDAIDGYGVLFIRCCVSRSQAKYHRLGYKEQLIIDTTSSHFLNKIDMDPIVMITRMMFI